MLSIFNVMGAALCLPRFWVGRWVQGRWVGWVPPLLPLQQRGCGGCDVLWQASPVSRPADLVLWSSGSALTLCLMSRTVHHCACVSDTVAHCGTCGGCHCLRVSADTPLTALHRASVPPVRTMN